MFLRVFKFICLIILLKISNLTYGQTVISEYPKINKFLKWNPFLLKLDLANCSNQLDEYIYMCSYRDKNQKIGFIFSTLSKHELQFVRTYFNGLDSAELSRCYIISNTEYYEQFKSVKTGSVFKVKRKKLKFLVGGLNSIESLNTTDTKDSSKLFEFGYSALSYPVIESFNNRIAVFDYTVGVLFLLNKYNFNKDSFNLNKAAAQGLKDFYYNYYTDSVKYLNIMYLRSKLYPDSQENNKSESEVHFESIKFINDSLLCVAGEFNFLLMNKDTCHTKKWYITGVLNYKSKKFISRPLASNPQLDLYTLTPPTLFRNSSTDFELNYSVLPIYPNVKIINDSISLTSLGLKYIGNALDSSNKLYINNLRIRDSTWRAITHNYTYRIRTIRINDSVFIFENYPKLYLNKIGVPPSFIQLKEGDQLNSFFLYNVQKQDDKYFFFVSYENRCVVYATTDFKEYIEIGESPSQVFPLYVENNGKILTYHVEGSKVYFNYILSK